MDGLEAPGGAPRPATPQLRPAKLVAPRAGVAPEVAALHTRAKRLDGRITGDVSALTGAGGGNLEDLDTRVKELSSLARKVKDEAIILNMTPTEATATINDALRYTAVFPPEEFTSGVNRVIDGLRERGYSIEPGNVRNFFVDGNRYKGLHVIVEAPGRAGGKPMLFELQFHTPDSIEMKRVTHRLYEVYRDLARPLHVRRTAYAALVTATSIVEHPPHVEQVGRPKHTKAPVA